MGFVLEDGTHEMCIEAVFPDGMSGCIMAQPDPQPARWWRRSRRDRTLTVLTHRDGRRLPKQEWQRRSAREVTEFNVVCYCLLSQGREANFLTSTGHPAQRAVLTTWKRVLLVTNEDVEQQCVFLGADEDVFSVIFRWTVVPYMQTSWFQHYSPRSGHE